MRSSRRPRLSAAEWEGNPDGTDAHAGSDLALPDVNVVSQHLDQARSQIEPSVGVGAPQFGLRRTILAGLAQRF